MTPLSTPTLLALMVILGLFGWHGYRRGVQLEAIFTFTVAGMRLMVSEGGDVLVRYTNNVVRAFQFVLSGGLGAEDPGQVFQSVRQQAPLVTAAGEDTFLLLLFLGTMAFVYWLTQKLLRATRSWLGAVLGVLNGYLLLNIFLPLLGGRPPSAAALARSTASGAAGLVERAPIVGQMTGQSGSTLLLVVIVGVVLLAAFSLQSRKG